MRYGITTVYYWQRDILVLHTSWEVGQKYIATEVMVHLSDFIREYGSYSSNIFYYKGVKTFPLNVEGCRDGSTKK